MLHNNNNMIVYLWTLSYTIMISLLSRKKIVCLLFDNFLMSIKKWFLLLMRMHIPIPRERGNIFLQKNGIFENH